MSLTHINTQGFAQMVNVDDKSDTVRTAIAKSKIKMNAETYMRVKTGGIHKGDVLTVAQVAGIMAAKQTSALIPMCHPLFITGADIEFTLLDHSCSICIKATVTTVGKTGVEMEALTAASICALTIYDMCKAMDKSMVIESTYLDEKIGGKSGHYKHNPEEE